nr:MAG TPA: hypothetical protein [Caudoviricetes sp.]
MVRTQLGSLWCSLLVVTNQKQVYGKNYYTSICLMRCLTV